jgi:hypothetical protein
MKAEGTIASSTLLIYTRILSIESQFRSPKTTEYSLPAIERQLFDY